MGANQSSYNHGHDSARAGLDGSNAEANISYYELLGIDRTADEDEIKKAYRNRALELHPDRNYGNVEETTKLFAEVQAAYEVLSDPQERAWYDSHCDASLVQGIHRQSTEHYEHDVRVTTAEDISRIILGFSGRPDYSDTEGGFYSTLRRCFDTLAKEEELACEWENLESVSYPSFGSAEDSHEGAVRPFYIVWTNFSTKKTFSWMDVYRYSEAPDRRTRRMMEKDNKRFRDEGIREFNETVRSFVAFIKKRDPRYIPNTQSEANRQKVLRDAAKAQAARSRAANLAKINEQVIPEWVKTEMPGGSKISEEETEDLRQQYECIVCKKTFKSENQYEVHENSKKHIKAVQHLRKIMQLEDVTLGLDNANIKHQDSSIVHPQATAGFMDDFQLLDDSTLSINELSITDTAELSLTKGEFGNEETNSESYDNYLVENEDSSTSIRSCPPSPCGNVTNFQPKIGKAKKKRMKKAARNEKGVTMSSQEFQCVTCQAEFPSKTRLFTHIKDLGHAQPTPESKFGRKSYKH